MPAASLGPTPLLPLPQPAMRAVGDILVHMVGAEAYWIRHVIHRETRVRLMLEAFENLESILRRWMPQRGQTLGFLRTLTPEMRAEQRPFPWDPAQTASVDEIVWHVVAHEQYHRGQVFTRWA